MKDVKFRFVNQIKDTKEIKFIYTSINELELEDSWQGKVNYERLAINLFTGLLDRQGKEIYEGDEVNCRYGECIIAWNGKVAAFTIIDNRGDIFFIDKNDKFEITGNIYEND